ncbi:Conidiation protein 6-domain-containing protein [Pseudoneurospora amorphoporcata]|uniref:Conidiation protein 6-domain-containing protein n=1 Tax=Pseudoneurospora amorphoporcata TaxID=241081 RepID=A0AAN6SFY5_9PEZI|nr:Conidiation protein 6-domain-containing protein [Pseudoneurospora amorphoporcata]
MLRSRFPIDPKPFPLLYARRSIATTAFHSTKMDPGNRERGLKAAINNPRVSEQAKQRDREILESEFGTHMPQESTTDMAEEEFLTDITSSKLGSPSASTAKKGRSKSAGSHEASTSSKTESSTSTNLEGKDKGNVIRGLKAAIHNPNVSEKAKEKDRKKLHDLGEPFD